ncbi:uncharacterized protein B0P05DRAFT_590246 [Gilbertella persicaria]|uniref:uncharacterized protein n=1 Tax=Gilbertella persicaria TaxID=101096 RepID=UPI00221F2BA9|nr:uncharacterized protein B0P05DRAFT_590246 [Gilbertella persicaria]KAI8063712.1 hypothetical protein B0P05DRAFT_590246 [Gilbertella persicaria]
MTPAHSSFENSEDENPMTIAATKLSTQLEREQQNAIASKISNPPCILTQHRELRTAMESGDTIVYPASPPSSILHKEDKCLTSQQLVMNLYLRPSNQADRRKEKDRQQRLHYLLKLIWKGIYRPNLKDPSVIVNWCCGVGLWNMEMATLFPNTRVIGVDFKEATLLNSHYGLPNLEFKYVVIHDRITGLESFEPNSVDYFMMRDCWLMNAPVYKWDNVLKEAYRILKPGGFIQIEEHSLYLMSKSSGIRLLNTYFENFFAELQVDRRISTKLENHLLTAGFIDVDRRSIAIPLGEWGSTECLRETGYLARDLIERRIRGLRRWVCDTNGISEEKFDAVTTQVMEIELNNQPSYIDWNSYIAQKPGTNIHVTRPSTILAAGQF